MTFLARRLLQPCHIGSIALRNRFALLPMVLDVDDFRPTDGVRDFYRQVARSAGLVAFGSVLVNDISSGPCKAPDWKNGIRLWDDDGIPVLEDLADICREGGSVSCAQLAVHYEACLDPSRGVEVIGPSVGSGGPFVGDARALSTEEIAMLVSQYGDATRRCKEAGVSMVEIHAGAGYLLSRFLSGATNHRDDRYGGSLGNRARFLREVVSDCRNKVGADYPIVVRFNAADCLPGGNGIGDACRLARMLELDGVAALSVQMGFNESPVPLINSLAPEGAVLDLAHEIKQSVGLPVIAGGRLASVRMARKALSSGSCDVVGMARGFIADPLFVEKIMTGDQRLIRPCICCSRCLDSSLVGRRVRCSVNPHFLSGLPQPEAAPFAKGVKVIVCGAGPAGMEAACTAAERGAQVALFDRNAFVGGSLVVAQVVNPELQPLLRYYRNQLRSKGIRAKLRSGIDCESDIVGDSSEVMATGARYAGDVQDEKCAKGLLKASDLTELAFGRAPHKGVSWKLLSWCAPLVVRLPCLTRAIFRLPRPFGKRVAVCGTGAAVYEAAMFLCRGHQVVIVDSSEKPGRDIGPVMRKSVFDVLSREEVEIIKGAELKSDASGFMAVEVSTQKLIRQLSIDAALVVSDMNVSEDNDAFLLRSSSRVRLVGDARDSYHELGCEKDPLWEQAPRIRGAVHDGFRAVMEMDCDGKFPIVR